MKEHSERLNYRESYLNEHVQVKTISSFHLKFLPIIIGNWSACISSMIVPLKIQLRSSSNECKDNEATWGLLHRPPLSTSSSNLTQLTKFDVEAKKEKQDFLRLFYRAVSFHPRDSPDSFSLSPPDINSFNSMNKSCGRCSSSSSSWSSSPSKNWMRAPGVSKRTRKGKKETSN